MAAQTRRYRVDVDSGRRFFVDAKSHAHATAIAAGMLRPPVSGRPGEWIERVTPDPGPPAEEET